MGSYDGAESCELVSVYLLRAMRFWPVVKMSRLSTTHCQDVSSFNSEPISLPGTNPKLIRQCLNLTLFKCVKAKR